MSDANAIELLGLSKSFGDTVAVDEVTFAVPQGEVFGFMGHNGAGKTTTIRMLLGLLRPTRGSAKVLGHDIVHESIAIENDR
jgi:ABC-2 type transport system ATP-binding protein